MPMENHRLVYTNSYHKVSISAAANRAGRAGVVDILKQCAEQLKKAGSELRGIEQRCDEAISRADTEKSRADDLQTQLNAAIEAKGKAYQEITSLKAQLNLERTMKETAEMIVTERDGQLRLAEQNLERLKKEHEEEKEKLRQSVETLKKQVEEKQQEINDDLNFPVPKMTGELNRTIEVSERELVQLAARKAANRRGRPEQQSRRTKRARVTFTGQSPDARVADTKQVTVAGQGNTAVRKPRQVSAIPAQIEMQETQTTNVPAPQVDLPAGDLPEDVEEGQRREEEEGDQQIIDGYPDA